MRGTKLIRRGNVHHAVPPGGSWQRGRNVSLSFPFSISGDLTVQLGHGDQAVGASQSSSPVIPPAAHVSTIFWNVNEY